MVDGSSLPDETPFDERRCRVFLSSTAHRGGRVGDRRFRGPTVGGGRC